MERQFGADREVAVSIARAVGVCPDTAEPEVFVCEPSAHETYEMPVPIDVELLTASNPVPYTVMPSETVRPVMVQVPSYLGGGRVRVGYGEQSDTLIFVRVDIHDGAWDLFSRLLAAVEEIRRLKAEVGRLQSLVDDDRSGREPMLGSK